MSEDIKRPLPFVFFLLFTLLFTGPGIVNHLAILIADFELNANNLRNLRPGLAYDIGHGSAGVVIVLLLQLIAPRTYQRWAFALATFLFFYHYADFCYFQNFDTHIPYYVLGYTEQAGSFTSSILFFLGQVDFFFQFILPLGLLILFYLVVSRGNKNWDRLTLKPRLVIGAGALLLFAVGNSYGNSYDSKTDENPLMFNTYRYLKITANPRKAKVGAPRQPSNEFAKAWPEFTVGKTPAVYHYYSGGSNKLKRYQPRALCNPGQPEQVTDEKLKLDINNPGLNAVRPVLCDNEGDKPKNVILLLLENFRALSTGTLGNVDWTPNFDKAAKDGILFTRAYANGARTKDAMVGAYCSIQSVPFLHIMRKYRDADFKCLPKILKDNGYTTSWIHNGDAGFDFRLRFFKAQGFDYIVDKFQMPTDVEAAGWGPVDEVLLDTTIHHITELKRPYFTSILTITNHHPYQAPKKFQSPDANSDLKRYRDTQRYTDYIFGEMLKRFRKLPDWQNTVLIVTGDHANHLGARPFRKKPAVYDGHRAHVPLLILYGDRKLPLKQNQITTLLDLPPLITDILGIDTGEVPWFGLSSFIDDDRRWHVSQIDHQYKAVRFNNISYFVGFENPTDITKKAARDLNELLRLNYSTLDSMSGR